MGPTEADIADLLNEVTTALPGLGLTRSDVCHAFAGLYPLTARDLRPHVYQGSGEYQVVIHRREDGGDGVISVLGAKYTTARRLAELATNLICDRLGHGVVPCQTGSKSLVGGDIDDLDQLIKDTVARYAGSLDPVVVEYLVHHYGTETEAVVSAAITGGTDDQRSLLTPLSPDRESVGAEVRFAVKEEMAVTLSDIVFRRTGLGTLGDPGHVCLRRTAEIMGRCLGWSEARMNDEVRDTQARFTVRES